MPRPPNRTNRIIMTDEARVLKLLRENAKRSNSEQRGFSMREAGSHLGWSSTYISHIENGRVNIPEGERLEKMLLLYGISRKYYLERIRRFRIEKEKKPDCDLIELLPRLTKEQVETVKALVKHFLNVQS